MFNVIEVTETYNRRGDVIKTEKRIVFSSENVLETVKYRYNVDPAKGYIITKPFVGMKKFVSLKTEADGKELTFAEMFRIIEGDEIYNAIMNDELPPVNERDWIAGK